jgi:hypothetical protein
MDVKKELKKNYIDQVNNIDVKYILIERLTKPGDIKKDQKEKENRGRNKELGHMSYSWF